MTNNSSTIIRVSIVAMVVLLVQACGDNEVAVDPLSESFFIENSTSQESLINSLRSKGIELRVDKDGRVWFSPDNGKIVQDIAFETMSSTRPARESFKYADAKYTKMLITALREKSIPFKLEIIGGEKHILLEEKDSSLWQPVKAEIDTLYEKDISQALNKQAR